MRVRGRCAGQVVRGRYICAEEYAMSVGGPRWLFPQDTDWGAKLNVCKPPLEPSCSWLTVVTRLLVMLSTPSTPHPTRLPSKKGRNETARCKPHAHYKTYNSKFPCSEVHTPQRPEFNECAPQSETHKDPPDSNPSSVSLSYAFMH